MQKLKFSVHPLFMAMGIALTAIGEGYTFLVYTMVMILHEMGHSLMAERCGYVLDEINLMPYGAVLKGSLEDVKARDEILIALFGPVTNILFAVLFMAVWWIIPVTYFFTEIFAIASLVTAIFNLLPVYPLDGGRILFAALKAKMPLKKAFRVSRITGIVFASAFLALSITAVVFSFNLTFAVIGGFIFFSSLFKINCGEYTRIFYAAARTNQLSKGLERKQYIINDNSQIIDCLKLCNNDYMINITVVDNDRKETGVIREGDLEKIVLKYPPETRLKEITELTAKRG